MVETMTLCEACQEYLDAGGLLSHPPDLEEGQRCEYCGFIEPRIKETVSVDDVSGFERGDRYVDWDLPNTAYNVREVRAEAPWWRQVLPFVDAPGALALARRSPGDSQGKYRVVRWKRERGWRPETDGGPDSV